jgi:7-cyano-7-deazaguanine synthase
VHGRLGGQRQPNAKLAEELGGGALAHLIRDETHSCHLGDRSHRHDWGYGCGTCPARAP